MKFPGMSQCCLCPGMDKKEQKQDGLQDGYIALGGLNDYPVDDRQGVEDGDKGPLTSREGRLHGGYPHRRLDW